MPSAMHQVLVELLRERPEVLPAVLASREEAGAPPGMEPGAPPGVQPSAPARAEPGVPPGVPPGTRIRLAATAFTNLSPPSYHADLALRVEDARGRLQELIIGEVQLGRDRRKHISWPIYLTAARAEVGLECPVTLVVVAPTAAVAEWCKQPIALDRHGSVVRPVVLGPGDIPRITRIETAQAHPHLAVLSALMHADSEDAPAIATAALIACRTLDSENVSQYADLVEARLDPVARRAVEKLMGIQGYRYQTEHARHHFAAGEKKGLEQGLEQGRREALVSVLASQLEQRFGRLPAYASRALAAADVDTLRDLAMRVLTAASLDDLVPRPARRRTPATAAGTRPRSRTGSKAETRNRTRNRSR
jgi:hypothetical protein